MPTLCTFTDCARPQIARGYCTLHYRRFVKYGDPSVTKPRRKGTCSIEGCSKPHYGHGLCNAHWAIARRNGSAEAYKTRRYGTGHINSEGYHLTKVNGSYKMTHRLLMEQRIGRPLRNDEVVHHKNENKQDNRIDNLELMTRSDHAAHHYPDVPNTKRSFTDTHKTCRVCGAEKPLTDFHVRKGRDNQPQSRCKACHKDWSRAYARTRRKKARLEK